MRSILIKCHNNLNIQYQFYCQPTLIIFTFATMVKTISTDYIYKTNLNC